MKAEHRKELETNTLADKVGEAMQRVKGGSRRNVLLYIITGAVLIVAIWFGFRWYSLGKQEASLDWVKLDDGSYGLLTQLAKQENNAGKAARFQIAWIVYWEEGVRMIGVNPPGALNALKEAGRRYKELAEECKDDPIFEPQAMLGIAVVEETRAVQDVALLKTAQESYQAVVDKYGEKEAAEAKFAKKRLDILKNKEKGKELELVYEQLQLALQIRRDAQFPPGFEHPDFKLPVEEGDKKGDKKGK